MARMLTRDFFDRPTSEVAEELLGMQLVRKRDGKLERFMITETEAYDGPDDQACHASKGRTKRTEAMFGPAGHYYVYLCYGTHWMLNIVTGPVDYPAAVLIRGIYGCNGPGRVTKALGVQKDLHTKPATRTSGLWVEWGMRPADMFVQRTPRIGVAYAGEWADRPWRYVLTKSG